MVNSHREMHEKVSKKEGEPIEKTAETAADTVVSFLDRVSKNGQGLKVDLEDVVVGQNPLLAKINGSVTVQVELAK